MWLYILACAPQPHHAPHDQPDEFFNMGDESKLDYPSSHSLQILYAGFLFSFRNLFPKVHELP